jgi:hypothetical protein
MHKVQKCSDPEIIHKRPLYSVSYNFLWLPQFWSEIFPQNLILKRSQCERRLYADVFLHHDVTPLHVHVVVPSLALLRRNLVFRAVNSVVLSGGSSHSQFAGHIRVDRRENQTLSASYFSFWVTALGCRLGLICVPGKCLGPSSLSDRKRHFSATVYIPMNNNGVHWIR